MSSNWFYSANGQQHGPITAATLKQLANSGQLRPDDLVCQEGTEQWVPANRLKGLFAAPPDSTQPGESLPQIDVGKAVKGVTDTIQGVVQSEPVQTAAASIKNAAGQAAEGVGNFIRSDAVQSQVKTASSFWSSLTTQNKLLAAGVGSLGLLMMSCCMCGVLGMMFGGKGDTEKPTVSTPGRSNSTSSSTSDVPVMKRGETDPIKFGYQLGFAEGCRAGERIVRQIEDQKGKVAKDHLIKIANEHWLAQAESMKEAQLDALNKGVRNSESIQKAIGYADGLRDTLSTAGYLR